MDAARGKGVSAKVVSRAASLIENNKSPYWVVFQNKPAPKITGRMCSCEGTRKNSAFSTEWLLPLGTDRNFEVYAKVIGSFDPNSGRSWTISEQGISSRSCTICVILIRIAVCSYFVRGSGKPRRIGRDREEVTRIIGA
jgi:hypothetical protein